jgi:PAS domain S-box-containing protein
MVFAFALSPLQAQFFNYQKYDIENSAAEGDIVQVQQDHTGAMWWVNDEYFTRYNGINYKTINYGDLAINYQRVLPFIDTHGDLWLCAIQKSKIEIFSYNKTKWLRQSTFVLGEGEAIQHFYATKLSGNAWVVLTTEKRMLAWKNKNWEELPLDETQKIYKQQAAGNTMYTHTDAGLFITRYGKAPYKIAIPDESVGNIKLLSLHENIWLNGSEPQLWMLTNNYIGYISNNVLNVQKLFDNAKYNFTKIESTGKGQLFLLDKANRLWLLDVNTKKFTQLDGIGVGGVIQETVNQLFVDRESNLWLAVDDGLIKAARQNISFLTKKNGMGNLPVQAVTKVGNKIIAAGPKGLNIVYGEGRIEYFPFTNEALKNTRQNIRQIKGDTMGNVWMLTNSEGLWHTTDFINWTRLADKSSIKAFEITPDRKILVAGVAGLYEVLPTGLKNIVALPKGVKANNIKWHNKALLLLSNKGIYKLSGKRWANLVLEDGKGFTSPAYALESVYENLAIIGTQKGIYYLKEFDLVKYANDTIWGERPYYGVTIDGNGAVWLASDTGIVVMDKRGAPKVLAYRGMQFKRVFNSSLITDNRGDVFISMRTGLMVFRANVQKRNIAKPMLQVSAIETREHSKTNFNTSTIINLDSDDDDITFYFDANSFVDESKNKLLYTLEGYMNDWEEVINVNSNFISFKNLPSGSYTLKLQLVNANGVASEIVSSPVINISKPFYNQWWFYAAAIAAFFAISFAIFYLYGQKKFEKDLISEVDKRSRELRSSEERFRTLWENTSDAIALYNLQGDIVLHNQTFSELVGKKDSGMDLMGRKIYDVLKIADDKMTSKEFRQNLEMQQLSPRFELEVNRDGEEIVVEFSNTYIQLPNEKSWVMLSLLRNITQRRLTEATLISAKNEAEQASRVKSAFLATMSHEIRTPLNAIIGMSSVMRDTQLSEEQKNYVSAIKTSSDSLLSLVNNILDFSKIEAGMMMIEKAEVKPEDCAAETLEILGNLANEKGIYLYYRIHPDIPVKILSDKTRLRQVLINLVGNAIKFTEKGYIEIAMKPAGNHQIKVSVTDTGIGIAKEKINGLFKVFTQVDDSTTRKYGGTGLGLAITDKLVNLLGGHIKVASKVGKGSQFTFTIKDFSQGKFPTRRGDVIQKYPGVKIAVVTPRQAIGHIFTSLNDERSIETVVVDKLSDAIPLVGKVNSILVDAAQLRETEIPKELQGKELFVIKRNLQQLHEGVRKLLSIDEKRTINIPISSTAYQRILDKVIELKENKTAPIKTDKVTLLSEAIPLKTLVVDDNRVNLMMMEVIMKNLGYEVDFANNGKEAVAKCEETKYDLVFMDLQMPEMDGIEATTVIKEQKSQEDFPAIVALTANAFPEDKQACLDAGMVDFLAKPVTIDAIKKFITKTFVKEGVEEESVV